MAGCLRFKLFSAASDRALSSSQKSGISSDAPSFFGGTEGAIARALALFPIAGDVVIAVFPAGRDGLLAMEHAVLEGNHDAVQLAEERHKL